MVCAYNKRLLHWYKKKIGYSWSEIDEGCTRGQSGTGKEWSNDD